MYVQVLTWCSTIHHNRKYSFIVSSYNIFIVRLLDEVVGYKGQLIAAEAHHAIVVATMLEADDDSRKYTLQNFVLFLCQ